MNSFVKLFKRRFLLFLTVFGPATITAMADNDAAGVATYQSAGATLGYPILFVLCIITFLLGITQEMGIRLAIVTRKGLGDLIREHYGIKVSIFIFACLFLANLGTIIVNVAAVKILSTVFHVPVVISVITLICIAFIVVIKGNYKVNQNIMLVVSLFFVAYIISAFKAKPDWGAAISNLVVPNGVPFTTDYLRNYIIIGLGVLGTTITPWGQFFISSFAFDKKIETNRLKYSQIETYIGAFITNFFSFFMIVATAATLFAHHIPMVSSDQAALAIKPFAGDIAMILFAIGVLNAGFMGIITVTLSTAYAFAEFFGLTGSLDASFNRGRAFYTIFVVQLIIAGVIVLIPSVSLLSLAIFSQGFNAMMLPFIFYYLIRLTNSKDVMGEHANKPFQKNIAILGTVCISIASLLTLFFTFFN